MNPTSWTGMKATGTPGSASACSSSAKAGMAWAAVDQQIVDQAPAIGLLVPQGVELVSKRVGNYQHNPVWGVALSQLWVV